jgi:hypothetical protein
MVHPELRHIRSLDLEPPALPPDPRDCAVRFQVLIGPQGGPESESFAFTAVTPGHLARVAGGRWGRGSLMLAAFDWASVSRAIAQLLVSSARPTWDEVATELNRVLDWQIGHNRGSSE